MTTDKRPTLAGLPAHDVVRSKGTEITDGVIEALIDEFPPFADLPTEFLEGDARRSVLRGITLFAAYLESGEMDVDLLRQVSESARRRAEEDAPLDGVMAAYFRGSAQATTHVMRDVPGVTGDELQTYVTSVLRFLEEVVSAVASGFEAHTRSAYIEQVGVRHSLLDALLSGSDVDALAVSAGVDLTDEMSVIMLRLGRHPDEGAAEPGATVARLRKERRTQEEFVRHYGSTALWRARNDGALVLVPASDRERLALAVTSAQASSGVDVLAARVDAAIGDVPDAAALARDVSDVARTLGMTTGVVELADVALDYQLGRLTQASPLLASRVRALEGQPDLFHTLDVYLKHQMNRRRTATLLGVHPNTVDNRLRRVADMTGLDPSSLHSWMLLAASMAALRSMPTDRRG